MGMAKKKKKKKSVRERQRKKKRRVVGKRSGARQSLDTCTGRWWLAQVLSSLGGALFMDFQFWRHPVWFPDTSGQLPSIFFLLLLFHPPLDTSFHMTCWNTLYILTLFEKKKKYCQINHCVQVTYSRKSLLSLDRSCFKKSHPIIFQVICLLNTLLPRRKFQMTVKREMVHLEDMLMA